jgi:hypothetical protein
MPNPSIARPRLLLLAVLLACTRESAAAQALRGVILKVGPEEAVPFAVAELLNGDGYLLGRAEGGTVCGVLLLWTR